MLRADMVICAMDATLEQGEEPFDRVGRDANSTFVSAVFADLVIHLIMLPRVNRSVQNCSTIRHNPGPILNVVVENRLEGLGCHALDMVRAYIAVPLDHRDYCLLTIGWRRTILWALSRHDGWGEALSGLRRSPTADVCFVNFHDPRQLSRQRVLSCGVSQSVDHEPGRFVRHAQHPVNLMGAHALLAGAEQVNRHEPDV